MSDIKCFLLSLIIFAVFPLSENAASAKEKTLAGVDQILNHQHACNDTIVLRHQSLSQQQLTDSCQILVAQENRFHEVFGTRGKPVADDNNLLMRANVYEDRDNFVKYVTAHFTMPTDNGGMYLEGYPDKTANQAEFVAYVKNDKIWNLRHEYVHYLDGRFNKYGDYCNGLHDDHAGPEFCPSPNLPYPHIVWWVEGIAEYIAWGNDNKNAIKQASQKAYALSELFNTSSNTRTGSNRVYRWGYLAVRFMMEHHRDSIEDMLKLLRKGDWDGYQSLIRQWGTNYDTEFEQWLDTLVTN